ncbi:MAG: ribonuclease HII [Candidatus Hydrogenedentes bacterium]|nr:ribonuclease HII [Candidatus Hydrogenedentota bacterium]
MFRRTLEEIRNDAAGGHHLARLLKELEDDDRAGARAIYDSLRERQRRKRAEKRRQHRLLQFEEEARQCGFSRIAGVDEAGRGPLAGPVVAAAVVLRCAIDGLDDSKKVLPDRREALYDVLMTGGHCIGVAVIDHITIDKVGIQQANYMALAQAVAALDPAPDFVLVDGFQVPGVPWAHRRIVKGDARSLSIAAASIVAKVTRDRMMDELHCVYPAYGFNLHKGYCTRSHLDAIATYGPCEIHRRSFAPVSAQPQAGLLFSDEEVLLCE